MSSTTDTDMFQGKIQIIREDNKLHIRGLAPGQQLFKTPDGRIYVFNSTNKTADTITSLSDALQSTATTNTILDLDKNVFNPSSDMVLVQAAKVESQSEVQICKDPIKARDQSKNGLKILQNVHLPGQQFCTTLNSTSFTEKTENSYSYSYFVVKIISGQIELSTVVVPSNWLVSDENGTVYLKYPIHLENDVEKLIAAIKTRVDVQPDWPKFGYCIEFQVHTFEEAVAFCTGSMRQAKKLKTSQSDTIIRNEIISAISTLKSLINQHQMVTDKKLEDLSIKVDELKNIIMDKKTVQEKEQIMTIDQLLQKHDLKRKLDSEETDALSKPVFINCEQFKRFEAHEKFMMNADFVVDLQKYFLTIIDGNNSFVQEIKKILNIFFSKNILNYFMVEAKPFKDTKFAKCLTECLLIAYKGVKNKIILPQGIFHTTITKTLITATFGNNYIFCMDKESGQAKRMKREVET